MTTTATAKMQAAEYRLTGITAGSGNCDRCNRELTQRVFAVAHKTTGAEMFLGRRCAAKATGYATTAVEREAARVVRIAEVNRRLAIIAVDYPTYSAVTDYQRGEYHVIATAATEDMFWGGRRDGEWRDYLDRHGAR